MQTNKQKKQKFYSDPKTVEQYEKLRFSNVGGQFVHELEEQTFAKLLENATQPGNILDIPCGTGRMFPMLKELSFENIYGGDYSDEMLIQCQSNGYSDLINISKRDIYDTKFEPNKFHAILSSRFLFHCDDQPRLFIEFKRLIKPNGYLIFDTLNWSPRSRLSFYSKKLGGDIFTNDHKSIIALANQYGFTVVKSQNVFMFPSFLYNFIPSFLMSLVRRLELVWPSILKTKTVWLLQKND
ncbi:class I SAM-dependent methyltransferase [Vibrio lentus]|uniref:class I SAM-dependent methyltransferase n=1 Tax=Vibrio lentus TaxID=136468 RepID=UPI000C81D969|nr:class I SAM-dependent methyltransferase [Vibrio lentus]TKF48407.1 class I SAM-dependent methyltransferase [Vibrio lentus]